MGNLIKRNVSLLGKYLWKFPVEHVKLQHLIMTSKHGIQMNGIGYNLYKSLLEAFRNLFLKG